MVWELLPAFLKTYGVVLLHLIRVGALLLQLKPVDWRTNVSSPPPAKGCSVDRRKGCVSVHESARASDTARDTTWSAHSPAADHTSSACAGCWWAVGSVDICTEMFINGNVDSSHNDVLNWDGPRVTAFQMISLVVCVCVCVSSSIFQRIQKKC